MECPTCHHWNEAGARFCEECGVTLTNTPSAPLAVPADAPPPDEIPEPAPQQLVAPPELPAPPTIHGTPCLILDSTGSIFKLGDFTVIGREDPSLQIDFDGYPDGKFVSHRHTQITKTNGSFYVEDLGSANHTWVNSIKLAQGQAQPLREGDHVRVGKIEMIFREGTEDASQ